MAHVNFDGILKELGSNKEVDIWDIMREELVDGGLTVKEADSLLFGLLEENAQLFFAAQFLGENKLSTKPWNF